MQTKLTDLMIFAAGFGSRMQKLTKLVPKPLIKVGDKALIDHTLSLQHKPNMNIIVNAHFKHSMIDSHLKNSSCVKVIVEKPLIFETGGGLKNAIPSMKNDTIFTLNSDSLFRGLNPLLLLEQSWRPEFMEALLLIIPPSRAFHHTGKSDFSINKVGKLNRDIYGSIYTGAQIIKIGRFSDINQKQFSLNLVWNQMLNQGTIYGIEYPGSWVDVGTPKGKIHAEKFLKGNY